jgi:5-methylcytosine-specific restriction protein A
MLPPHRCSSCKALVTGKCPTCAAQHERERGSAASRGYDAQWQRLRAHHLQTEPLCRRCLEQGHAVAATEVDHIRPFHGLDDPLRLDRANLQSLCEACHDVKHGGREITGANRRQTVQAGNLSGIQLGRADG